MTVFMENEERYRILADNVQDAIWTTDNELNITYVTPSIEHLTGYTPEEFLNLPQEKHLPRSYQRRYKVVRRLLLMEARRKNPTTHHWEFEWYHKSGRSIWVETSTSAIYRLDGKFFGFVCVTRETTEKVMAQRELELVKEEALSASRAKSEFLANMSHEIRTPMNGVLGMLQLLQQTNLTAEQSKYVYIAMSSGSSLNKIISDILDFSKIEAGKIEFDKRPFAIKPVIDSVISCFSSMVDHDKVELTTEIEGSVPEYMISDESRLRQILSNLVENSIKFTQKGKIKVHLFGKELSNNSVKLYFVVSDTGIGVAPGTITCLFEPFVQADDPYRRKKPGTGLGLSIVKRLVELMDGDISVSSDVGKGTTISLSVIVETSQKVPIDRGDPTRVDTQMLKSLNILVVEDDNINAMVITSMLKKLGHYTTLVKNGYKALSILKQEDFDCILMDIQMPEMDGIETTKAIRDTIFVDGRSVPIIALTAHAMKGDKERFIAAGMDEYLTKPVEIADLKKVLKICL